MSSGTMSGDENTHSQHKEEFMTPLKFSYDIDDCMNMNMIFTYTENKISIYLSPPQMQHWEKDCNIGPGLNLLISGLVHIV